MDAVKLRRWLWGILATPSAVYGLILYQALIAAIADDEEGPSLWLVTIYSIVALVIFFCAHVFAEWVAAHGPEDMGGAGRRAFAHSTGMLISAIPPTVILLVCAILNVSTSDAEDWAMLSAIVVLAFLGYESFAQRGYPVWLRIVGGALGTALLGTFIIFLNYLVH